MLGFHLWTFGGYCTVASDGVYGGLLTEGELLFGEEKCMFRSVAQACQLLICVYGDGLRDIFMPVREHGHLGKCYERTAFFPRLQVTALALFFWL